MVVLGPHGGWYGGRRRGRLICPLDCPRRTTSEEDGVASPGCTGDIADLLEGDCPLVGRVIPVSEFYPENGAGDGEEASEELEPAFAEVGS